PPAVEEADGAAEEAGGCCAFLVVEHLDVGQPGRVVDRDMHVLPADPTRACSAVLVDTVAGTADLGELLHVEMHELAGPAPLLAVRRLVQPRPGQLAEPVPGQDGT